MEAAKAVRIGRALAEADLIIIGTSNGFDMAEGFNLFCADAHFRETYGDLAQTDGIGSGMSSAAGFNHYNRAGMARAGMGDWQQAFGFKSLFDGFYHLYPSLEQQWAYYARYIDFMLREPASRPYLDLRSLIDHKDYFILSTNVDTQVEKTFPAERICNYQGSFAHLQCKQPCCDELFDASPYVERMLAGMAGFEVRSEDVPRCPHCGWQLAPWVRGDTFLQGAAWRESLGRYERFARERGYGRVLLLELGVGEMTPGIITLPFWSMAAKLPDAHLLSVSISGGSAPLQLGSKAEAIQADLGALLSAARVGDESSAIYRDVFHAWALKKKASEPERYSRDFVGGFALWRCRNSIGRYSAAPKCEFRSQFPLFQHECCRYVPCHAAEGLIHAQFGRIRPLIRDSGNDSIDSRNRRSLLQSLPGFRRGS